MKPVARVPAVGAFPVGVPMKPKKLALSAVSLMLVFAFLACRAPGIGGSGTPTFIVSEAGEAGQPGGAAVSTPAPGVPTNTDGAETIVIPGGTFWMGSEEADTVADEDEKPRHQVTLGTFPIYTHEVTNEMYARCIEAGACTPIQVLEGGPTSHYDDPAFAEHPVVGVDWNMADDYCTWADARLPTEAEWEYAARGTESLIYPWGSEEPACDRVNMLGCLVPPDTAKVGSYAPGNSPFEVWDMSGNVWEWTHDWYDPDYYALSSSTSPLGPNLPDDLENPQKVVRGGGLQSAPAAMRSAARVGARPLRAFDDVGFRCVAQGALDLPAGYAGVSDGHEMVPPDSLDGGGELVEDPDEPPWGVTIWEGRFTCPDAEGRVHLALHARSTVEPTAFSVSVEGTPFDCSYDPGLELLECSGFPPPEYDTRDESARIEVCYEHASGAGCLLPYDATKPDECPAGGAPDLEISASASCPDDAGLVTVTISSDPAVTWVTTHLEDGFVSVDIPCWPLAEGEYRCIVPARAPGELYTIFLYGFTAEGLHYYGLVDPPVPERCPGAAPDKTVSAVCYQGHPAVEVTYSPTTRDLDSVSTLDESLSCIGMAPGVQICGELSGTAGSDTTVTTCFEGEACTDWTVTVPDCAVPGGFNPNEYFTYVLDTFCETYVDPVEPRVFFISDFSPMASLSADGVDLVCDNFDDVEFVCLLPGSPGDRVAIDVCLENGVCFSDEVTAPNCEPEPSEGGFTLADVGCTDETHIYFIVDTGLEWLVPGRTYHVFAGDHDRAYSCSIHPTLPGRVYCSSDRPDSPDALDVCVEDWAGESPHPRTCDAFEDWPARVETIPDCASPPVVPACSSYTTGPTCVAAGCKWDKGPPDGKEHCYPP
jgi:sulfatase modifying factor 1